MTCVASAPGPGPCAELSAASTSLASGACTHGPSNARMDSPSSSTVGQVIQCSTICPVSVLCSIHCRAGHLLSRNLSKIGHYALSIVGQVIYCRTGHPLYLSSIICPVSVHCSIYCWTGHPLSRNLSKISHHGLSIVGQVIHCRTICPVSVLRSILCRTDIFPHLTPPAPIVPPDEIPQDIHTSVDLNLRLYHLQCHFT